MLFIFIYHEWALVLNQRFQSLLGPPVNSEYYPGWLDYWGEPHEIRNGDKIADSLDKYLSYQNASVTVFMAHGGTSFGLESGAYRFNYSKY